jgi:hypothetical protein
LRDFDRGKTSVLEEKPVPAQLSKTTNPTKPENEPGPLW